MRHINAPLHQRIAEQAGKPEQLYSSLIIWNVKETTGYSQSIKGKKQWLMHK
ncbi:hypothetical protein BTN49_1791 [Candidatus Enterovibrio escicola]|uniref:Uncharacterized protein n=1 Tax=Candidatus Enterovibrio escicola TaxID=1927127 RepID=A0A2A5T368_9GAMM|nr:hypothetical protein BTN49_1791 [Candidatus Enterovibrio escacola]